MEAWSQSLLSNGFQCQVRGRLENQGILTWGFPEEVKAEPKPGKGDERKKRSVFLAEAAECAETRRQESSPTVKELEEVQCSWVIPWADLKEPKLKQETEETEASQSACWLKEIEFHVRSKRS